jgi:hypothetical protein
MSAIPNLKIPITIVTKDVGPALAKVERDVAASAAKVSKISGGMGGGGGMGAGGKSLIAGGNAMLGGGPLGAMAMALGPFGMAIGGAAAGLLAANAVIDMFAESTKGAGAALDAFNAGGGQTMATNVVILERLASLEKAAQEAKNEIMTWGKTWVAASAPQPGEDTSGSFSSQLSMHAQQTVAYVAALWAGKSFMIASLEGDLAGTTNNDEARAIKAQIEEQFLTEQIAKADMEAWFGGLASQLKELVGMNK